MTGAAEEPEVAASGAEQPRRNRGLTLSWENDTLAGTDRYYTNGVRLSLLLGDWTPGFVDRLTDTLLFCSPRNSVNNSSVALGQSFYTPADISRSDLIEDDRPYAGWLFGVFGIQKSEVPAEGRPSGLPLTLDVLELHLGVVGPASLAEETQTFVHKVTGSRHPNGWDHQLHNEPGVDLIFQRKWKWAYNWESLGCDFISHAGFALGNVFTHANGGFMVRLGFNLDPDFAGTLAGYPLQPTATWGLRRDGGRPRPWVRAYLFTGVEGRAVAWNIFLDGNTVADSHSVTKRNFVADLDLGAGIAFPRLRELGVTYTYVVRTEEFVGQDGPQDYGSIQVFIPF